MHIGVSTNVRYWGAKLYYRLMKMRNITKNHQESWHQSHLKSLKNTEFLCDSSQIVVCAAVFYQQLSLIPNCSVELLILCWTSTSLMFHWWREVFFIDIIEHIMTWLQWTLPQYWCWKSGINFKTWFSIPIQKLKSRRRISSFY